MHVRIPAPRQRQRLLMGAVLIDMEQAREALALTGTATAALVSAVADGGAPVPGLAWTVRETAAHVVTALRGFTASARGTPLDTDPPSGSTLDARLSAINAHLINELDEKDPRALAALIDAGVADFLGATAGCPGEGIVATPWYGEGASLRLDAATCIVLGELLIHGRDIALGVGQRRPIDPLTADLVIRGTTSMMPMLVNPQTSRGVRASFDVRIRGGVRFTFVLCDGALTVEPEPSRSVDCHISADPVAWLLLAYGRAGQWGPIARGQLLTWGRKPWLALRSRSFLLNP